MKYGIIFCGYNTEEFVRDSLNPWVERDDCIISAISVPFAEYSRQEFFEDKTIEILHEYKNRGEIKYLTTFPRFIKEHEARNMALSKFRKDDIDAYFLVDSDEIYKREEIDAIFDFVKNNPACWYKVSLKNYVFDKKTYLEQPFCPPRIFRNSFDRYCGPIFCWDNDMAYWNGSENSHINSIPFLEIPREVAWVNHYSWLNNEISKRKVKYQNDHFGGTCSFAWDKEKGLVFNEEYYKHLNAKIPNLLQDK